MIYSISGYDPISDDLIETFVVPEDSTKRVLEIVGNDYDGVSDYNLTALTLDSIAYALVKYGFKINLDLTYSIGPIN
jgi:hypothetical protein